jgi:hypothetical protein
MALLLLAALVLLPTAALGSSARGPHDAVVHAARGPGRGSEWSRAHARKRGKARQANRRRRRPPKALADVGGLPPPEIFLGAGLDWRGCAPQRECGAGLRFRVFGEREVEGLVHAADDLYEGAVLRDKVGFWLWPRASSERLTLSPLASPGDRRYGVYITGCFE